MIRFPKHHIATSVVNRILNIADEVEARAPSMPSTPEPIQQGQALDAALAQPTPDMPPMGNPDPSQVAGDIVSDALT